MTLTECFVKAEIHIDFGSEILYGSDQAFESYPCRFATVGFELMSTDGLTSIADCVRREACRNVESTGYYNFYFGLNDYREGKTDSAISFVVVDEGALDNEEEYLIELSEEEQSFLFERVDEQCRVYIGKSCEELLLESRKQMEGQMNTKSNAVNDPVNRPSHYTDGKIEVIDFIEDKKLGYHLGNAVKYICRAGKKDPAKEVEDLQKAAWYINRKIEKLMEGDKTDEDS